MTFIADAMNGLFDLLTAPFGGSAAWAMFVLSIVTGVAMLLLFKISTNQDRLEVAKRRLMGHIYEMGLYQESLAVLMRIQRDLALANFRYLGVTFPALIVIILPVMLILAQFDARFAHRPLESGESTLVTVEVEEGREELLDDLGLSVAEGLQVESFPVRDREARSASWRVRVTAPGSPEMPVTAPDGGSWTKRLEASEGLPRMAGKREKPGFHHVLFNPSEKPLPGDGPLSSISLRLPERTTRYLGVPMHWLVAFCLVSLGFGFAVKDLFGVKI